MEHGVGFDHFEMDMAFDDYIVLCFPKTAKPLLAILPSLATLRFLHQYQSFKEDLLKKILASFLYSFVLLILGMALSYFFLWRFEPSVRSLLGDYGTDISILKRYRFMLQIILVVLNLVVGLGVFILILVQSKDLKILFIISLLKRWPFLKQFLSYQYAKMLLLFLQFDMKTSQMIGFLRNASIGDTNKWLSYHIESHLDQGKLFPESLDLQYFDAMMVDFVELGYLHSDVASYLSRYCDLMKEEVSLTLKRYGSIFKMFVFSYLMFIVALFYSTLYLPLQLLEGL